MELNEKDMREISKNINKLSKLSNIDVDRKSGFDGIKAKMKAQDELIDAMKVLAQRNKTLYGRLIKFPCNDSYAFYIVTKLNIKTVRIDWFDYCDGWVDSRCGHSALLDIRFAEETVFGLDKLEKIFSDRKPTICVPIATANPELLKTLSK